MFDLNHRLHPLKKKGTSPNPFSLIHEIQIVIKNSKCSHLFFVGKITSEMVFEDVVH